LINLKICESFRENLSKTGILLISTPRGAGLVGKKAEKASNQAAEPRKSVENWVFYGFLAQKRSKKWVFRGFFAPERSKKEHFLGILPSFLGGFTAFFLPEKSV
jgi:hypothetical protein